MQTSTGVLEFVPDPDRSNAWLIKVNGALSSHVDLDEPRYLDFEYMQWLARALDVEPDRPGGLRVVHLGGGGCTLPRYLMATRPTAQQTVVEVDPTVVREVSRAFGLAGRPELRMVVADALDGLRALPTASQDVVVRDVFARSVVPPHVSDAAFHAEVRRVLRRPGRYLANIIDEAPFPLAGDEIGHLDDRWASVSVVVEDDVAAGVKGNLVVVAGDAPAVPELAGLLAECPAPARLWTSAAALLEQVLHA